MEANDVDAILEEARIALAEGRSIYADKLNWRLHALAEAGDEKAKAFFATLLWAEDNDWRLEGLRDVGFHYHLDEDPSIVARMRELLLTDRDDHVKLAAASILGIRSSWPDRSLYQAMTTDADTIVRKVAFQSLLDLSGMSFKEGQAVMKRVAAGELPVSVEGLRAVLGDKLQDL